MKYDIVQERDKCIGCGACVAACPKNWGVDKDGKSSPLRKIIDEKDLECNKEAAMSCPVQIIHIAEEKGKGKKKR